MQGGIAGMPPAGQADDGVLTVMAIVWRGRTGPKGATGHPTPSALHATKGRAAISAPVHAPWVTSRGKVLSVRKTLHAAGLAQKRVRGKAT